MIRKLSIAAAIATALLMPTSAFADPAQNNSQNHKNATVNKGVQSNKNATVNKNVHRNKTVNVNKAAHGKYVVGKAYNGHYWYGENRHRWHGRWYAYGDGPCWIKVDGLWFWNASTCAI